MILLSLLLHLFKGTLISHWRVITKIIPKQRQSNRSPRNVEYVAKRDGICPTTHKRASSVLQDTKHTVLLFHSTLWPLTSHRALATDGRENTYKRSANKNPHPRSQLTTTQRTVFSDLQTPDP